MRTKTRKQRRREVYRAADQGLNALTIALAESYLQEYPKDGRVWLHYGNALVDFSRYREAKAAILKAIANFPEGSSFTYSAMGDLYDRKGDFRRAAEWYLKAVEGAPGTSNYLVLLGVVYSKAGNHSEAEACFRRAVECRKGAIDEAYYNLGWVLAAQGEYAEALTCFHRAVELDPKFRFAKQAIKDLEELKKHV